MRMGWVWRKIFSASVIASGNSWRLCAGPFVAFNSLCALRFNTKLLVAFASAEDLLRLNRLLCRYLCAAWWTLSQLIFSQFSFVDHLLPSVFRHSWTMQAISLSVEPWWIISLVPMGRAQAQTAYSSNLQLPTMKVIIFQIFILPVFGKWPAKPVTLSIFGEIFVPWAWSQLIIDSLMSLLDAFRWFTHGLTPWLVVFDDGRRNAHVCSGCDPSWR